MNISSKYNINPLGILIAAFAYAEANRCRPMCSKKIRSPIRCVREGSICRKMRQCSIDEENCRRRQKKLPSKFRNYIASMFYCITIFSSFSYNLYQFGFMS